MAYLLSPLLAGTVGMSWHYLGMPEDLCEGDLRATPALCRIVWPQPIISFNSLIMLSGDLQMWEFASVASLFLAPDQMYLILSHVLCNLCLVLIGSLVSFESVGFMVVDLRGSGIFFCVTQITAEANFIWKTLRLSSCMDCLSGWIRWHLHPQMQFRTCLECLLAEWMFYVSPDHNQRCGWTGSYDCNALTRPGKHRVIAPRLIEYLGPHRELAGEEERAGVWAWGVCFC